MEVLGVLLKVLFSWFRRDVSRNSAKVINSNGCKIVQKGNSSATIVNSDDATIIQD